MIDKKKRIIIICLTILLIILVVFMFVFLIRKKTNTSEKKEPEIKIDKITDLVEVQDISDFHNGLAYVRINGKYGYIDKTGKFVIKPQYSYAQRFSEGFAMVCKEIDKKYNCGLINTKGETIIDLKYVYGSSKKSSYSKISDIEDGLVMVKNKDEQAVFDTNGKQLTSFMKDISLAGDGFVSVWTDDSCTIVNPKNNMKSITNEKFSLSTGCKNGICNVCKYTDNESKDMICGVIDYKGNVVINYSHDTFFMFNKHGVASVKRKINNEVKYGLINKNGLFVVEPIYKFNLSGFHESEGFTFQKDDKTIVAYDGTGKEMFTLEGDYRIKGDFFDGFARISKKIPDSYKETLFYVNEEGVVKFGPYEDGNNFSDGLAFIKDGEDGFFFINSNGKKVITGKFEKNKSI